MLLLVAIWIFCGIGASVVAKNRGADGCLWFALGALFGPFGLAFAFMAGKDKFCPSCRKRVHPEAIKCPYCQTEFSKADAQIPAAALRESPASTKSSPFRWEMVIVLCGVGILVTLWIILFIFG
jgi:hypothetical protein